MLRRSRTRNSEVQKGNIRDIEPYKNLLMAILEMANNDVTRPPFKKVKCPQNHNQKIQRKSNIKRREGAREKVYNWFLDNDTKYPFSFVNICSVLGYSRSKILAEVEAKYALISPQKPHRAVLRR